MAKMTPPIRNNVRDRDPGTIDIEDIIAKAKPMEFTEQSPPTSIVPIQLKIPEVKKNEFKAYAAMRGKAMNVLFLEMFEEYKEKHR